MYVWMTEVLTIKHILLIIADSNLVDLLDPDLHIDYSLWYDIGLELGIKDNKLNEIKANNAGKPDYSICCARDMFYFWITGITEGEPTYEKLAIALSALGMRKIAATILRKKCSKFTTTIMPAFGPTVHRVCLCTACLFSHLSGMGFIYIIGN